MTWFPIVKKKKKETIKIYSYHNKRVFKRDRKGNKAKKRGKLTSNKRHSYDIHKQHLNLEKHTLNLDATAS